MYYGGKNKIKILPTTYSKWYGFGRGGGGRERGVLDFFIKNNHVHRLENFFVSNISTWVLLICLFARSI